MVLHYVTTYFKCIIITWNEYSFLSKQSVMSVCKTAGFLSLNQISELVWDSQNYDAGAPGDNSSEDEGGSEDEPGVSHLQPDRPTSSGQASSSSFVTSASDGFQSGSGQQWTRPSGPQRGVVHTFTGGPRRKRNSEAPHINDSSSPLSVFLLYFAEIITLLVTTLTELTRDLCPNLT